TSRGFSHGIWLVLALFALAIGGTTWVSTGIVAAERWPIRWLEVNGSFQRVSAEQLRSSLAPLVSASFFTVDLQKLQDSALRKPWVASVNVQKKWPDTVVVTVEEFQPLAHWNDEELVSTHRSVFAAPDAAAIQGLPWLDGPESRLDEVLEKWEIFNSMLAGAGLEIERLELHERGSWAMQLNNGSIVQLGRDDAEERLDRLMRSWRGLMVDQLLPPVRIDLRYTNGFAVLWPDQTKAVAGIR
ncbi:MAG TPA: FtsQ-type POTRA domain-containing protein, partial [Xanthomonadales bacterium]|nr:FtsQ-type POTRA domain-containing protein [Xanthomonadales bacterium]